MLFSSYSLEISVIDVCHLNLFIHMLQYPGECCPFEKLFRHLSSQANKLLGITYCESVFRKSSTENVVVF